MDHKVQSELDLISAIYDAVIEPALWPDVVERIRRHFGLFLSSLAVADFRSQHSVLASSKLEPHYAAMVERYSAEILDLWGGPQAIMRLPLEEPLIHSRINPPENWAGNLYYENFGRPQGLVDQIVVGLELNPNMVAYFSMGRHESMPPLDDDHVDRLRVFAPHLRRAVLISNLLQARAETADSFEAVLTALGTAVVMVDQDLQIVYANPRADEMLKTGEPLRSIHGRLDLPGQLAVGQFARTINAAAAAEDVLGSGSGIPARLSDGRAVVIHVFPLHRRASVPRSRAVAAVFVAEPNAPLNLPLEAFRMLYDLRPAELRVFELLAAGMGGRAVAETLHVSPSTAKTHTLRLFDKLGVHTRAEIVQLAHTMSLN